MTKQEILRYEIVASWWAPSVKWEWVQNLTSRYFAWKVRRKWARFEADARSRLLRQMAEIKGEPCGLPADQCSNPQHMEYHRLNAAFYHLHDN